MAAPTDAAPMGEASPDPKSPDLASVANWCARFRGDRLAARLIIDLKHRSDEIWRQTFELLQRESPEYRNAVDDEFAVESKSHCNQLLRTIVALAEGRPAALGPDPFAFVRQHAEWRARHNVPLTASLHAYRLGHRTYWAVTREAAARHARQAEALQSLTMLSEFWLELFDHVGAVLAEAHAGVAERIIAESTHGPATLIETLLRGDRPGDADGERLLRASGIRDRAAMVVVLARPIGVSGDQALDADARHRALARALDELWPNSAFGKLIAVRGGEVVVLLCGERETDRHVVEALRRGRFLRRAAGQRSSGEQKARIGVSLAKPDIAHLPEAAEEAHLALDFASDARAVVAFSEIDLGEFLVRRADPAVFRLVPTWARAMTAGDDERAAELARTIRAFAECSLNVKRTAQRLAIHTNTVYFRLNRIAAMTGVDPRVYAGIERLLTGLRLVEMERAHRGTPPK